MRPERKAEILVCRRIGRSQNILSFPASKPPCFPAYAPAQLAEKNDDRHIRNKIEGVNRSRGEAARNVGWAVPTVLYKPQCKLKK